MGFCTWSFILSLIVILRRDLSLFAQSCRKGAYANPPSAVRFIAVCALITHNTQKYHLLHENLI